MDTENIKCLLEPGDQVQVKDFWGPRLGGKKGSVLGVRRTPLCESGFLVRVDFYESELDANWFIKLSGSSKLESAIQLIKDIRHGNVYNDIPSVCEKWLIENGIEKL